MNEIIETFKDCGFMVDILIMKDGSVFVALHDHNKRLALFKTFSGIDADAVINEALLYAQNCDAYVNTASRCGVRHQ